MSLRYLRYLGVVILLSIYSCKKKVNNPSPPINTNGYNVFQILNTTNSGLPSDSIRHLFVFQDKLFISTSNGLAVLQNNQWQVYNTTIVICQLMI